MLRKLAILKSFRITCLISVSQYRFASEKPAQYTMKDLYDHRWLEYDPTHKVENILNSEHLKIIL